MSKTPKGCDAHLQYTGRLLTSTARNALIHQQGIIPAVGGIAFARSSLRRIVYTFQSSLLGAPTGNGIFDLHLTPCW